MPTCCSCHIDSYKIPFPPHHANHATTSENFPGEDLEHEPSSTAPTEHNQYPNTIPGSKHYEEPTHQLDYPDTSYHQESTKVRPSTITSEYHHTLPKYLEAPRPQQPILKPNFNLNYKRSNTPKPPNKRPSRPVRRRPSKPIRDLAQSESNFGQITTELPISTTTSVNKELTRKINYNYHPIIDFFKPDQIESRMDIGITGDSEWRPVTSMLLATVTERSRFQER